MSRTEWTDPAPLEVERPRLPWWTMLPWKVLIPLLPVVLTVAAVRVLIWCARRVYRYPVALVVTAGAVALYAEAGWVAALAPVLGIAAALAVWWWQHRASFTRYALAQLRSEYRRASVYAFRWSRTLRFSDLCKKGGRTVYTPTIRYVRSDGWRDRIAVKLLPGQCPADYERRADALAHSFGAMACRVRVIRPRRIVLDFLHTDPLALPIPLPPRAEPGTVVDLRRLVIGRSETGRPWFVRLLGNHLLIAGSTGAGKASVAWSILAALAPAIRSGMVQVFGIDPKGGMELGKTPHLFVRLVRDNGEQAVLLLEHVATLTRQRAEAFARAGRRSWSPDAGQPFVVLLVDELADVVAYQTDRKLRERANLALQVIASQGRAPGVCLIGELQDPRKEVLSFRHLFPTRTALRLDEPTQVDMLLGDGVRDRGAAAHEISEATPGVAWVKVDGAREPDRVRAFHVTDTDLDTLDDYVVDGRPAAPRALPGSEAA